MGSIRGRVRLHVPKDRRAVREKVYGGSDGHGESRTPLLPLNYPFPLLPHKLPGQSHIASCLWFLNDPWLWLYACWFLSTASSFGSWLTDPEQMHPETLRKDGWVLCHQVRHSNHMHTSLITGLVHTHTHGHTHTHTHYSYTCASYTCIFFFFDRIVLLGERSGEGPHFSRFYQAPHEQVNSCYIFEHLQIPALIFKKMFSQAS